MLVDLGGWWEGRRKRGKRERKKRTLAQTPLILVSSVVGASLRPIRRAPWSPMSVCTWLSQPVGNQTGISLGSLGLSSHTLVTHTYTPTQHANTNNQRNSAHLPRINDKRNQPLVLKVKLPHQVIRRQLCNPIRAQRSPGHTFHLGNGTDRGPDEDEFGLARRRRLEQQTRGLEEQQNRIGVDHHVILQRVQRQRGRGAVIGSDGRVGHHDIQMREAVRCRLQFFDCRCGIGLRRAVEFHDDEAAVPCSGQCVESRGSGGGFDVTHAGDHEAIGSLEEGGHETLSDTCFGVNGRKVVKGKPGREEVSVMSYGDSSRMGPVDIRIRETFSHTSTSPSHQIIRLPL